MAHARLLDYKGKLQVLRQVHSDKAKHFDRLDGWLNYGTLVATIIITCVGFLGFENMKLIFDLFGRTLAKNAYDAGFNVLVLGLLIFSVLNVALGSGRTAQKHYESITNITKLLGSGLFKSTTQGQQRGRQRRGSFARACRSELRCA
jgi:hypothetical protein